MKMSYIITIIIIILCIIGGFLYFNNSEGFSIYSDFKTSLNEKNLKVRKNNWTYYKIPKHIIEWAIETIQTTNNHNIFLTNEIYYGHPDLEFNYSHTMADKVILSNNDYNKLVKYYNTNNKSDFLYDVGLTIVHECMHILQRFNYENFKVLYKSWGYIFSDIIRIQVLLKNKRQNPDANDDDVIWCDGKGNFYFINCFYTKNSNVEKLAYPLYKVGNKFEYRGDKGIPLHMLKSYNDFFGKKLGNNYTPNEIYAEYTEIYYLEGLNPENTLNTHAYQMFKDFNL